MNIKATALETIMVALRGHLVRSAYVVGTYGTDISASGSYILVELDRDPSLNIPKLADSFKVNRSSISRAISGLIKEGMLEVEKNPARKVKGQRKKFVPTEAGRRYLKERVKFIREKVEELSAVFSSTELKDFVRLMNMFAEGSGAPAYRQEGCSQTEQIMSAFTRITMAHGIPQEDFVDSKEPVGTWVILSDILYNNLRMHELAERYHVEHVQLSQVVRRFVTRGFLKLATDDTDARMKEIEVTPKGKKLVAHIESLAVRRYERDLKALSDDELIYFSYLIMKYVGAVALAKSIILPQSRAVLSKVTAPDEKLLQEYRTLQINFLKQPTVRSYALSESLYSVRNEIYAVHDGNVLIAGAEVSQGKEQEPQLINTFVSGRAVKSVIAEMIDSIKAIKGIKGKMARETLFSDL